MRRTDNYDLQAAQAKKLFLTYDQNALIQKCRLGYDTRYLYATMLAAPYRIDRQTGDMQRLVDGSWVSGNSFAEIMVMLDWLCDCRPDRFVSGQWMNPVTQGTYFHRDLQESEDPDARLFDANPEAFCSACEALGGERHRSGDISYAIGLVEDLRILLQLWHGDEEFAPRLRCLWDTNTTRYIRYETTWYAAGLLLRRIREAMQ